MQAVITTLNTYKAQMQGILKRHDCSVVDCADIVQRIQFVRKQDCINAEITNLVVNLKEQVIINELYSSRIDIIFINIFIHFKPFYTIIFNNIRIKWFHTNIF